MTTTDAPTFTQRIHISITNPRESVGTHMMATTVDAARQFLDEYEADENWALVVKDRGTTWRLTVEDLEAMVERFGERDG